MRKSIIISTAWILALACNGWSQPSGFTNFIRQVQYPGGLIWDMSVNPAGSRLSDLPIDPGGAQFELWTVKGDQLEFLLDSTYVGTYIPVATLEIISDDPYPNRKRTRADKSFTVRYSVSGLKDFADTEYPPAAKSVNFLWHVQSYGPGGNGKNINPDDATLMASVSIDQNNTYTYTFPVSSIPSTGFEDFTKLRGEERFAIYSLDDYQAPASQLASDSIQIWPCADATISGIENGQLIRFELPTITVAATDLYPASSTNTYVYPGPLNDNPVNARLVPGLGETFENDEPQERTWTASDYAEVFDEDGLYTIEVMTKTVFGTERLAYKTFPVDRTMKVRGTFSTAE